jgi:hypothetical protein
MRWVMMQREGAVRRAGSGRGLPVQTRGCQLRGWGGSRAQQPPQPSRAAPSRSGTPHGARAHHSRHTIHTSMVMSAPAMNPSGLPEMSTAALMAGSVSRRVSTPSNAANALADRVFTFSPGASNFTTAMPSAVTVQVTGAAASAAAAVDRRLRQAGAHWAAARRSMFKKVTVPRSYNNPLEWAAEARPTPRDATAPAARAGSRAGGTGRARALGLRRHAGVRAPYRVCRRGLPWDPGVRGHRAVVRHSQRHAVCGDRLRAFCPSRLVRAEECAEGVGVGGGRQRRVCGGQPSRPGAGCGNGCLLSLCLLPLPAASAHPRTRVHRAHTQRKSLEQCLLHRLTVTLATRMKCGVVGGGHCSCFSEDAACLRCPQRLCACIPA